MTLGPYISPPTVVFIGTFLIQGFITGARALLRTPDFAIFSRAVPDFLLIDRAVSRFTYRWAGAQPGTPTDRFLFDRSFLITRGHPYGVNTALLD